MVDVAEISIWGELLGAVRWDLNQQLAYFEYDSSFIQKKWDVSPIKMPISAGKKIYSFPNLRKDRNATEDTFKGLPGLLADALPDKYGNQLINIWLAQQGRPANSMNPVEQLCFIGKRGMGALIFEPAQIKQAKNTIAIEINSLINIAKKMLEKRNSFSANLKKSEEKAMQAILKIGTSAGGARPKALIAYNTKTGEIRSGQTKVPKNFEHWLLKLDGVSGVQFGESSGWGRVEYAYYLMAIACGINMSECKLLEENGRAHFMTKRFDRDNNIKHHTQTLCGLQHFDFNDMFSFSYEQLFQTMRQLRLSYPEAEQMFRRMVFNVIATNFDDHTKNFSFLMKKNKNWELAPAYDICFSYNPQNHWVSQQTLSINGKRLGITKADMLKIAEENNIKNPQKIIKEINYTVKNWKTFAFEAKIDKSLSSMIDKNLQLFT